MVGSSGASQVVKNQPVLLVRVLPRVSRLFMTDVLLEESVTEDARMVAVALVVAATRVLASILPASSLTQPNIAP